MAPYTRLSVQRPKRFKSHYRATVSFFFLFCVAQSIGFLTSVRAGTRITTSSIISWHSCPQVIHNSSFICLSMTCGRRKKDCLPDTVLLDNVNVFYFLSLSC